MALKVCISSKLGTFYNISTQLELAQLEDALKFPSDANKSMVSVEETSQFVTGKVQSAILKKEAALTVHSTYQHILDILKKV